MKATLKLIKFTPKWNTLWFSVLFFISINFCVFQLTSTDFCHSLINFFCFFFLQKHNNFLMLRVIKIFFIKYLLFSVYDVMCLCVCPCSDNFPTRKKKSRKIYWSLYSCFLSFMLWNIAKNLPLNRFAIFKSMRKYQKKKRPRKEIRFSDRKHCVLFVKMWEKVEKKVENQNWWCFCSIQMSLWFFFGVWEKYRGTTDAQHKATFSFYML